MLAFLLLLLYLDGKYGIIIYIVIGVYNGF